VPRFNARRVAALTVAVWAGVLLALGLIGAPSAFASGAASEVAGRIAGRMFAQEAHLSLFLSVVLFVLLRGQSRTAAESGAPVFSTNLLLVLGALFCTVLGYFALQPMMAAARAGQGTVSFGALHGISAGLFGLKGLLVIALAWRLTAR
jgi:hypothetical protein